MFARRLRSHGMAIAAVVVALAMLVSAVGLLITVDVTALGRGLRATVGDPIGLAVAIGAFAAAFWLRAVAWRRVLPGLGLGHAFAALHVTLGANHLLPLRLGEPLRVVSVVRRAGVPPGPATASTVALRSADIVVLLGLGVAAGPGLVGELLGRWGLIAASAIAVIGAVALGYLARRDRAADGGPGLPGPGVLALTAAAWGAEAIVVWQVARGFGIDLTATDAVVVLAAAVSAQVVAVTPGGVGTYEAAATSALVAVGVAPTQAVTLAVGLHVVKTVYSLLTGAVAAVVPAPTLFGRFRLPRSVPRTDDAPWNRSGVGDPPPQDTGPQDTGPQDTGPQDTGPRDRTAPVVLFLPARDEAPRVAAVIARAPATVAGHPVEVVVVDDASTDDTVAVARTAGATVVNHPHHRGLGAAVRTGLAHGVTRGAVAVAFCDADGEYDPAELERLVVPLLEGRADYVVGNRFTGRIGHMRAHRRIGNRVLTRWVRFLTRVPVDDGQSGYRALSATAARLVDIPHDYNYAQVLTVDLCRRGLRYHEVPISYSFRASGRSFVRLGPYLRRVVPAVWRQLNAGPPLTPAGPR